MENRGIIVEIDNSLLQGKLYSKNSVPLQEVDNLAVGEEYFTKEGNCYQYVGEGKYGRDFKFVKATPLMAGELLPNIKERHVLKLFWVLSKNMK